MFIGNRSRGCDDIIMQRLQLISSDVKQQIYNCSIHLMISHSCNSGFIMICYACYWFPARILLGLTGFKLLGYAGVVAVIVRLAQKDEDGSSSCRCHLEFLNFLPGNSFILETLLENGRWFQTVLCWCSSLDK